MNFVNTNQTLPELEKEVLKFWKQDDTFLASVNRNKNNEQWTFYDGPPFANGLPHYGHLLTGYAKDVFPRFQTMLGKCVPRQFGWDTHGLPAELEAMKQLGLTEKQDVEKMGVDVFNNEARKSVLRYVDEWKAYVERQGRWVDFDNGYKTLDLSYMESVLWAFKQLHEQDLAYEGYRVLPYCWKDQTPLSTHELSMDDDVYKQRHDVSATVKFALKGAASENKGLVDVKVLAWTTTPWTLPMNLALAVNSETTYCVVKTTSDELVLLSVNALKNYYANMGYETQEEAQEAVVRHVEGKELVGLTYQPLFDYYTDTNKWGTEAAWTVLAADYVTDDSGTGVVHLAPAHGEEDQKVCELNGVPAFLSVDETGKFLPSVTDFVGLHVFKAVKPVLKKLYENDAVFSTADYSHDYPHCWRCGNPLMYKAVSSWFVRTTALKEEMLQLNEEVNWKPENVKHGVFKNWLSNVRDWSVSRNRYWGSPVPVWKSDNPDYPRVDVYGSLAEMEQDFGVKVTDLHRPFVDNLVRVNPDDPTGVSMMRRVEDVLDVWFDSGSMPFAQMHYPFENKTQFEENHPSDFVVEYVGQTRGWFYVMHVLSTALFKRPAYKNAVSHGVVLGDDGLKMSKSKLNYPDVNGVFNKQGSDVMRWFLMSSSVLKGGTLSVSDDAVTASAKDVVLPLLNAYNFYDLYVNKEKVEVSYNSTNELDQYVLSKLHMLTKNLKVSLENFDTLTACKLLADFMDMLNNWYVRRSRNRFWSENQEAFNTLHTVLETFCRLAAPLLPMTTEAVWKNVTGQRSVHLTDYPSNTLLPCDSVLVEKMDELRKVCSVALALRKKTGHRVRQPLAELTVVSQNVHNLLSFEELLKDELNVKRVSFVQQTPDTSAAYGVQPKLVLNSALVGKRLGRDSKPVFVSARNNKWVKENGKVFVEGVALQEDEFSFSYENLNPNFAFTEDAAFVVLDTVLTDELLQEGFMRDMVRAVQNARKQGDFDVSDRVEVGLKFNNEKDVTNFDVNNKFLAEETLAKKVVMGTLEGFTYSETVNSKEYVNEGSFEVFLKKFVNKVDFLN
jgi:isoleucyl-tRNA synthetase